jgi:hypothetical protein
MTQQDLVNRLNELHLGENGEITRFKMSAVLNQGTGLSPYFARKIEIALDLPKYSIVSKVGFPKGEREKKKLEGIGEW